MKRKSIRNRFLSIVLTVILVISSTPMFAYAQGSERLEAVEEEQLTETIQTGEEYYDTVLGEIVSRREENVKHFDIGYGRTEAISYAKAVHRKDANGVWQDIDNRLYETSYNSNLYSTADGRAKVAKYVNSSEALVSLNENGYKIDMSPILKTQSTLGREEALKKAVAQIRNHEEAKKISAQNLTIKDVAKVSNTTKVQYTNVFASTDLEYVLTSNDIKENIIVKKPTDSYNYSFALSLTGLVPELRKSGDIVFLDSSTKEEKYRMPAPYMYDSNNELSYDVKYELKEEKGNYIVSVIAESKWINSADRAFPVTIDPTIMNDYAQDVYIDEDTPNTNHNNCEELRVSLTQMAFIQASMPTIPAGCDLYSARLYFYFYFDNYIYDGSTTVGAYKALHSWNQNTLTWNIADPELDNYYIDDILIDQSELLGENEATANCAAISYVNITSAVREWYNDPSENYGIVLRRIHHPGDISSVCIHSTDDDYGEGPYFSITYTEPGILSGVYKIKNLSTGMYLNVKDGGYKQATWVQQASGTDTDNNLSQLFKVTFLKTVTEDDKSFDYYSIRPMTNSALGLDAPLTGKYRSAWLMKISLNDNWSDMHLRKESIWAIGKTPNGYTIKNGDPNVASYLTGADSTLNGSDVYTADNSYSLTARWKFVRYEGAHMTDISIDSAPSSMWVGNDAQINAHMYTTLIGVNGPIQYFVSNSVPVNQGSASIGRYSGTLTATGKGTVRIGLTCLDTPCIVWHYVTIKYSGCRPYLDICTTTDPNYGFMNCHGYALNSISSLNSQLWFPDSVWESPNITTSNDALYAFKPYFESWMNFHLGSSMWEDVTNSGGINAEIGENQWLVVMRVGYHPYLYMFDGDYHFWYRTNTGEWANKHSYDSFSELLGSDLPTNNDSSGWKVNPNGQQYYDSDLIYYRISR